VSMTMTRLLRTRPAPGVGRVADFLAAPGAGQYAALPFLQARISCRPCRCASSPRPTATACRH
jgi:hypothetical protein